MPTIGVLLPGSSLYPSIGLDILQGLKSSFHFHRFPGVEVQPALIGYGAKEDEVYQAAEKLLVTGNAEAVVVCAGNHHARRLAPLAAAAGKLLLFTNAGDGYPLPADGFTHTLFHSLNDSLSAFLTGRHAAAAAGGAEAILATSFYDGGYAHTHTLAGGFETAGGQIVHHFGSHYQREAFTVAPLAGFIRSRPGIRKLMASFSGELARLFYEQLAPVQQAYPLQWYVSPMMLDDTPGDFSPVRPQVPEITGYSAWVPELDTAANRDFCAWYRQEHGREPNRFSVQGWEAGLLLAAWLRERQSGAGTEGAIGAMTGGSWPCPRGDIRLHESRQVTGSLHLVRAEGPLARTVAETLPHTADLLADLADLAPEETHSAWKNTYLCL